MSGKWIALNELDRLSQAGESARPVKTVCHLVEWALAAGPPAEFFRAALSELAGELGVGTLALATRNPEWSVVAQQGRWPTAELPWSVLADVLDREAGTIVSGGAPGLDLVLAPIPARSFPSSVLCAAGRGLPEETLEWVMLYALALAAAVDVGLANAKSQRRIDQLASILKIASGLSAVHETEPLLELIARESTRLLGCDRASIFLWDREHQEVVACPALGVNGQSLRLPDRTGIVGEVIHGGHTIRVDDAYRDARFSQKVDHASGYKTRNLLCVPLRNSEHKLIGAFEGINKLQGAFTDEDEQTLTDLATQVAAAVQNTREREALLRSHRALRDQARHGATIIGDSPKIKALRSTIVRLAGTDLPVLILGESGTGKEVVAQTLHYEGPRAERPFIAVNCAALTETLLESELFGHEKGAFTDAHEMRRGKFELAEGGTIFLDEIGDMSLGGQAKLLRVLEQKVITRVGGSQAIPINARIVAATNANLADAVRAKKFREDLYFRLNVVTLELPPLRERPEDIQLLADHFLQHFAQQSRRPGLGFSAEARKRLQAHAWPGNVRELRNLMERVAFLAPGEQVEAEDLAFILSPDQTAPRDPAELMHLSDATNAFQQEHVRRAIRRVRGNMSEAARLLGLHRSNLYRKMRQLGMSEANDAEGDEDFDDDQ